MQLKKQPKSHHQLALICVYLNTVFKSAVSDAFLHIYIQSIYFYLFISLLMLFVNIKY